MTKRTISIIIFILTITYAFSQEENNLTDNAQNELIAINDGPYIFIEKTQLIKKTIVKGKVSSIPLGTNAFDTIFPPDKFTFNKINKIAALSDIHGQYNLAIEILKNNKIIDKNLNWDFGKGHLVIVGDVFDRGDKVTEMLWLIYKLEGQAKKVGGHVHFVLGNHEYMVLHKDLRYISEKYQLTSKLMGLDYDELFNRKTVIGRWLRSKPTIIKINNNVFTHGGVSKDFIANSDFEMEKINEIMRKSIDRSKQEMKSTDFYNIYYGSKSLIWYRGYFNDNLKETEISEILGKIKTDHIVVGHCSNDEVVQLFNKKVFGVDSSIKKGEYGEILFIENNNYSRRTLNGKKKNFKQTKSSSTRHN